MFELRAALSYLFPRKGQLSTSIIGLIAVLVISAITWLVLVFFSATEGFEVRWSSKIQGLLGTYRVIPNSSYFQSPYFEIEKSSSKNNFLPERVTEKALSSNYDESLDPELSNDLYKWQKEHERMNHPLKKIETFLDQQKISWRNFDTTISHIEIKDLRINGATLSQYGYIYGVDTFLPSKISWALPVTQEEKQLLIPFLKRYEKAVPFSLSQTDTNLSLTPNKDSFSPSFLRGYGYPVFLPKTLHQQGVRMLDKGAFQFSSSTMNGNETLSLPFYVAGFFDPGILPIGGKLVLTSRQAVLAIEKNLVPDNPFSLSGIILDTTNTQEVQKVTQAISQLGENLFTLERFDQYDMTKELFMQLQSEKTLFRLITCIIIAVASSNIFSMLFILSHDKRKEIAVFRAHGASTWSILTIFALSGLLLGLLGSFMGSLLAGVTLHFLPELLQLLSQLQGHDILQSAFYGEIVSERLSISHFLFTIFAISFASLIAGTLAALRVIKMDISEALKG